ncbi:fucolectin-like [Clarias gariepinus]
MLTQQAVDVALGGIATQSSTFSGTFYASMAIDGNTASNFYAYSCSSTNVQYNPWWRVNLLAVYDISNVIITNRGDCCPERMNGAEIRIGNSLVNNGNSNPRCVVISSIPAGGTVNYTCKMRGRYVNIVLPNMNQYLTICEVQVYGVRVPVTKRAFLRLKFKTSEDLINPIIMDKVLQKHSWEDLFQASCHGAMMQGADLQDLKLNSPPRFNMAKSPRPI